MEIAHAYKFEEDPPTPEIINGFDLDLEIAAIRKRRLMNQDLLGDTKGNVYGWVSEYVLGLKVFQNPVKLDENGYLVNSISGVRLVDITDSHERQGKPLQAVANAEQQLAEGEVGGVLLIASPSGDSQDQKGRLVHLKHTQVYAFEKKATRIDSVTIVIDNNLDDNRQFLKNSGKSEAEVIQGNTEYDQICHVAGIAAYLSPERGLSLEGVIAEISRSRKENNHPLAENVRESLQKQVLNRENSTAELERANRIIALYFGQFEQFVMNGNQDLEHEFTEMLVRAKLQSILEKIAHEIKFGPAKVEEMTNRRLSQSERVVTYRFLGSLTGCSDRFGGGGMAMIEGPFGWRMGYFEEEKPQITESRDGKYYLWVENIGWVQGRRCENSSCTWVTTCGKVCCGQNCGRILQQQSAA